MSEGVFDHAQLAAIQQASKRVAENLGAVKDNDKLIVSRAVFDIAAETDNFDPDQLVEMAKERLNPRLGWRFS
jgi:hypothetical protein